MKKNLIELLTVVGREAYPKMEELRLADHVKKIARVSDYEEINSLSPTDQYDFVADTIAVMEHPNWFHKIEVKQIMDTSYEDGSCWIEYLLDEMFYGYIHSDDISDDLEELEEGMEEEVQGWIDCEKINPANLFMKRTIDSILPELAKLIEECRQSDNDMWFVEYEDVEEQNLDVEKIEKEVERLGLEGYVTFDENDCAITVYGGVITQFLF